MSENNLDPNSPFANVSQSNQGLDPNSPFNTSSKPLVTMDDVKQLFTIPPHDPKSDNAPYGLDPTIMDAVSKYGPSVASAGALMMVPGAGWVAAPLIGAGVQGGTKAVINLAQNKPIEEGVGTEALWGGASGLGGKAIQGVGSKLIKAFEPATAPTASEALANALRPADAVTTGEKSILGLKFGGKTVVPAKSPFAPTAVQNELSAMAKDIRNPLPWEANAIPPAKVWDAGPDVLNEAMQAAKSREFLTSQGIPTKLEELALQSPRAIQKAAPLIGKAAQASGRTNFVQGASDLLQPQPEKTFIEQLMNGNTSDKVGQGAGAGTIAFLKALMGNDVNKGVKNVANATKDTWSGATNTAQTLNDLNEWRKSQIPQLP